jgi:hypothetical protein
MIKWNSNRYIKRGKMDAKATYKELKQNYAQDLEGQTVSLKEAAERYQIATGTIYQAGLITA